MKQKTIISILLLFLFISNYSCSKEEASPNNSTNSVNSIEGVWMTYGSFSSGSSPDWMLFFPNGKSLTNMPTKGLHNYNIANETQFEVGTYTWNGTTGLNKKNNVSNYQEQLVWVNDNEIKVDNQSYYRCQSITGKKLNGGFTSYANPNDPDLNTLPAGQNPKILFDNEGNFEDWGIFNTILYDAPISPTSAQYGYGTYELKDYSILLHYSDGREKQEAFNCFLSTTVENAQIIALRRVLLNKIPN